MLQTVYAQEIRTNPRRGCKSFSIYRLLLCLTRTSWARRLSIIHKDILCGDHESSLASHKPVEESKEDYESKNRSSIVHVDTSDWHIWREREPYEDEDLDDAISR